ncbi:MAG TPA: 2-dehydropantoate 2-reductase N-terminal domain-containing protein [Spirochaetia bacterium]|nr:2-dehydropantoate 2-reductase N-terminal domain-containing protein [Spirochaetia bacterium]
MKTTIVGPGAVGTLIGGLLRLDGHEVTLVGRNAGGPRERRVRISHPAGWLVADGVKRVGAGAGAPESDAWIVTLGRHHLHTVRRPDFARLTSAGSGPVFFFNCDPAEPERLAVPRERRRLGLTLLNAVRLQDDDVELCGSEPAVVVERAPGGDELFGGMGRCGVRVVVVDDALPFMNSFFIWQLLFLPVALCNLTLPAFLAHPDGRALARSIMEEGFQTMEKAAQPLAPLPAMDPRSLAQRIEKKPGSFEQARETPDRSYNPVLQAYLTDRPLEASFFNRRLVEMASSAGLHLTWNWRVMQKAGRVGSVGFYREPADLLRSLE